jgi:hypothetical protein
MKENKNSAIEEHYNDLSDWTKEDIGFPSTYLCLTNAQESFILDILSGHEKAIKEELTSLLEEMKELVDDI